MGKTQQVPALTARAIHLHKSVVVVVHLRITEGLEDYSQSQLDACNSGGQVGSSRPGSKPWDLPGLRGNEHKADQIIAHLARLHTGTVMLRAIDIKTFAEAIEIDVWTVALAREPRRALCVVRNAEFGNPKT